MSHMMTLGEFRKTRGQPVPDKKNAVGIEIEVEFTERMPDARKLAHWTTKPDGSLRHAGLEFVSDGAQDLDTIYDKIVNVCTCINSVPYVKFSPRTSVHVHVNVNHLTPTQIVSATLAWWMMESSIVPAVCRENRVGNLFSLMIKNALANIPRLVDEVQLPTGFDFNPEHCKYYALNLATLYNFGTLEVRTLHGEYDPRLIHLWTTGVANFIYNVASAYPDFVKLIDDCEDRGYYSVLSPYMPYTLRAKVDEYRKAHEVDVMSDDTYFHVYKNFLNVDPYALQKFYDKKTMKLFSKDNKPRRNNLLNEILQEDN